VRGTCRFDLKNVVKQVVRGPSLTTKPLFDVAAPTPAVIMDALTAATCRSSFSGARLMGVLVARGFQSLVRWIPGVAAVPYGGPPLEVNPEDHAR
jgi:hypothetical protein